MHRAIAFLGVLALAACHGGGGGGAPAADGWAGGGPSIVSMDIENWNFRYGAGVPQHAQNVPGGGFAFEFPTSGDIDYLTTNVSIAAKDKAHAVIKIEGTAPTFTASDGCSPAAMHIMLEVRGDDIRQEDGRWWARLNGPPLGVGDYTIDVSVTDLSQWSNVQGHVATDRPAQFRGAMANLGAVGITFGACSFGHGVTATGSPRMTVTEFSVQ